jgi:glyoxylase-like metal-dependent hydrolase (beta-lactamase superfamily II)
VNTTRSAQPGRLGQPWVREIVPGVFRVGTTFLGCYAVEDAGAYTFIDAGLPGYWPQMTRFLAARNAPLSSVKAVVLTHYHPDHGNTALSLPGRDVLIVGDTLATLSLSHGEPGPQLLPRFLNEDHDQALASLEKIEPVQARWILPGHGLPWEGSPQQAVKLARQIAARTS